MEYVTSCPICTGTSFTPYLACKDYTTSKEDFHLTECANCKFVITNPRPSLGEISRYYESDKYISHTGGTRKWMDLLYRWARRLSLNKKRKLIQSFTSQKGRLLDYGCGTGEFIHHLQIHQWTCEGIEPSKKAREKASKLTKTIIHKDISDSKEKAFDVISMWHVLEHVPDLNETLKNIHKLLTINGLAIIAVPNRKSYDAKKYGSFWAAYDVPRHFWHFSKENMENLLTKNNFRLIAIKPMKLDSFYISLLSEEYKSPSSSKITRGFNALAAGLKSNSLAKEDMNYSSLIYIARK